MMQFKKLRLGALTSLACLALAVPALATPIIPTNVRPVPVPGPIQTTLQNQINSVLPNHPNFYTGQSTAGMWQTATSNPLTTIPTLEYSTGNRDYFGIWFGSDTHNLLSYVLWGPTVPLDGVSGAALGIGNGFMTVSPSGTAACGPTDVNCGVFVNAGITPYGFGFFEYNGVAPTAWTADSLSGGPLALSYNDAHTNWYLAFNDGSNASYSSYGVKVESIQPVPEPATLLLFGTALFGLAFGMRNWRTHRPTA